jgi:HEAT repeats
VGNPARRPAFQLVEPPVSGGFPGKCILNASLHEDAEHRRQALAATISANNAEAVEAATGALQDKDSLVRQSAALALGQMKATDAVPAPKRLPSTTPARFHSPPKRSLKSATPAARKY